MPKESCRENIHFVGIGGIGVSALAQYYAAHGCRVSGSDLLRSETTDFLKSQGIAVFVGQHAAENARNTQMVIYSPAIKSSNPELQEAKKRKIKCVSYPEALGELTKKYFTIAVSGTHGKSTTSAMVAMVLIKAGFDPTVIIGTKLREFGNSNFKAGKSKFLVIEADEHFASFLSYWPKIIVLTNIDKDHLDYYKNLNNIIKTFIEFVGHLPTNGTLIMNGDDKNSKLKIKNSFRYPVNEIKTYSIHRQEAEELKKTLQVPGEHNVSNALAALMVARALDIPDKVTFKALAKYKGAWRRFQEVKIRNCKFKIVSDYAHHPAEITATIQAAKERFPGKTTWAVFQPHQYQRTHYLFRDFVNSFGLADNVIITDIYGVAGREEERILKKVSARKLADETKKRKRSTYYIQNFKEIPEFLKKRAQAGDVILIMGAGDIYQIAEKRFWK